MKRKVGYYYDEDIPTYYYAANHPMKPFRTKMVHELLTAYGVLDQLEHLKYKPLSQDTYLTFHTDEYIEFLSRQQSEPDLFEDFWARYGIGEDCPIFDGLWEFCQKYTSGTITAADYIINGGMAAVNWSGGLHHGKPNNAEGFCYLNDIVLGIIRLLLNKYWRVLYVDIDFHHGDGVEEAFYTSNRVLTFSTHMGNFFPYSGYLDNIGLDNGKGYSVNVPLKAGVDDQTYLYLFQTNFQNIVECFYPEVIVMQSGADSLAGDRLGVFNLSVKGHAECMKIVQSYGVPLIVLGGGGYTLRNVPLC